MIVIGSVTAQKYAKEGATFNVYPEEGWKNGVEKTVFSISAQLAGSFLRGLLTAMAVAGRNMSVSTEIVRTDSLLLREEFASRC